MEGPRFDESLAYAASVGVSDGVEVAVDAAEVD
jgi:hypothetical protein